MKIEDLFKKYSDDDDYDYFDQYYNDDDDWDDDDDEDDDGEDYDDDDDLDDDDDQDEDQDQDDQKDDKDKDRDRDKDDKDKDDKNDQKDNSDDSSKDGDQSSEKGDGQGEDKGKNDAGQDQEAKDNLDKNIDDKDVENKVNEAKEKEADGAEGHSSDAKTKNPRDDANSSGLDEKGGDANKPGGDSSGKGGSDPTKGKSEGLENGPGADPKEIAKDGPGKTLKNNTKQGLKEGAGDGLKNEAKQKGAEELGKKGAKEGIENEAKKKGLEEGGKLAATEGSKDAAVATTSSAAGGSTAGGSGLISLIGSTMPWSLIVIGVIIIIIIIIIIISFFQTLPGSLLGNLKRTIKEWACDLWANATEIFGDEDNTRRISKEEVNDLAKYINDMGYDIQTYGFGDIEVKKSDNNYDSSKNTKNNRADKDVEDDGATDDLKVKSKYLKAYLAADECTYHFRGNSFLSKLFDSGDGQKGLINVNTTGGGLFNGDDDQLRIDRKSESIVVYNHSIDIPIVGFFKKLFTGSRSFAWGEIIRYDLNTWIGRYKRPVELFLALHIATMMPDLTYTIATDSEFNTEVDVHFEPIKICLKGNLEDDTAYIRRNGETYTARQIIKDYFSLFKVERGIFDSSDETKQDKEVWHAWSTDDAVSAQELWDIFTELFEKFDDIESWLQDLWNWFKDWEKINVEDYACALMEDDMVFDDLVDLTYKGDSKTVIRPRFYDYFDCGPSTLNLAKYPNVDSQWYKDNPDDVSKKGTLIRGSGKFTMSDMEKMIKIWNTDRGGKKDADGNYYGDEIDLDGEEFEGYDSIGSPEFIIRYLDEGIRLKLKHEPTSEEEQSIVYRAYVLYKFGTEDIMPNDDGFGEGDQGGLDNMLWPFVSDVKNHWYYKDIDFLGTSEDNATYRLAKVGYKTIQYKTSENGMNNDFEMPCALYPNKDRTWDFLVYQVAEPVTEGCNENIKNVFSDEYYRYDGTEETARMIANTRRIEELKDKGKSEDEIKNGKYIYYYGSEECDVDLSNTVDKEAVKMPEHPEKALNALAIVKNMHSLASDYIYRDLKELFVKLEYYTKEEMTEDLKLMMLWPIEVNYKNETFDWVETYDQFGKAIVAGEGRTVLAPMDGTIVECDGGYEIYMDTLNPEDAELLAFIFQNDFYRINKDALKTMKVRLSGVSLDTSKIDMTSKTITVKGEKLTGAAVKRGDIIGTVNNEKGLSVMIRKEDDTVIEDIAEYMREDHNNKYEEIMRRRMASKDGQRPPIPLRSLFDGTDSDSGDIISDVTVTGDTLVWPIKGYPPKTCITSDFGYRDIDVAGASKYHHGIDIGVNAGTPIVSASNGKICGKGETDHRGIYVLVFDETTKTKYVYQHMQNHSPLSVGDEVKAGQVIGYVGQTGIGSGPHLHFEIHINDSFSDSIRNGGQDALAPDTMNPANYTYISVD